MSTLAIVGAGAKAVAVAAKASVLREMGIEVPGVVAVERIGVAANWQLSVRGQRYFVDHHDALRNHVAR